MSTLVRRRHANSKRNLLRCSFLQEATGQQTGHMLQSLPKAKYKHMCIGSRALIASPPTAIPADDYRGQACLAETETKCFPEVDTVADFNTVSSRLLARKKKSTFTFSLDAGCSALPVRSQAYMIKEIDFSLGFD